MTNRSLSKDYIVRSRKRLKAVQALFEEQTWADVVRESQEVVELALKGLLRHFKIEVPRIHDVSDVLLGNTKLFPQALQLDTKKMAEISRDLRRDRELAYYGTEDLTPSEFYKKEDAVEAQKSATWIVSIVEKYTE